MSKEYIERESLIEKSTYMFDEALGRCKCVLVEDVDKIPTADVVEVTRCRDCKHRYVPTRCALYFATVDDKEYFVERGDDFYCSYGERKDKN